MTSIELKCKRIFEALSKMTEYVDDLTTKRFKNLENLNIRFRLAPGARKNEISSTCWKSEDAKQAYIEKTKDGYDILSYVHFDTTATEFLPNGYLFWKELERGEYEKVVNALYRAVV